MKLDGVRVHYSRHELREDVLCANPFEQFGAWHNGCDSVLVESIAPSFSGGFRVVPRDIEFLRGRGRRLHDRSLYTRMEGGTWKIERPAP